MKQKRLLKILMNVILIMLIFGILLYLVQHSLQEIIQQLFKTKWTVLLWVIGLGGSFLVIEGKNMELLTKPFQPEFTYTNGFFLTPYSSFYRLITFGTGTAIAQVLYFKKRKVTISQGLGLSAIHLIIYKSAMITIGTIGVLTHWKFLKSHSTLFATVLFGLIGTAVMILVIFLLVTNKKLHHQLIKLAYKIIKKATWREKIQKIDKQIESLRITISEILKYHGVLSMAYLLNIVKLIFWYSIPYVVIGQHQAVNYWHSFILVTFVSIIAGIVPSPAGIGSFEFFYLAIFSPAFGTVDSVSSMLLYRFSTYLFPCLIGLIFSSREKRIEIKADIKAIKND